MEQGGAPAVLIYLLELARATASRLRDHCSFDLSDQKTAKGLTVTCRLDRRKYPVGREITKEEMKTIRIIPHAFHGDYVIRPRPQGKCKCCLLTRPNP